MKKSLIMKKSLLFLSVAIMASATSFALAPKAPINAPNFTKGPEIKQVQLNKAPQREEAEEETETPFVTYSKAGELANMYSLNGVSNGNYIYLAFKMTKEDQIPFIGNKISAITLITPQSSNGKNPVSAVQVFVTDQFNKLPENYTKGSLVSTPETPVEVALTDAYEITGENDLYIGYRFKYGSACYYIPVDEQLTSNQNCLISVTSGSKEDPLFNNYADQIGSLCISVKIEGYNLPENVGTAIGFDIDPYFNTTQYLYYYLRIKNDGVKPITMFKATCKFDGSEEEVIRHINLDEPIPSGQSAWVKVDGIPSIGEGYHTIDAHLYKVNEVLQESPRNFKGSFMSYDNGYSRRIVIEEGTGTGCGWCPRGIVMMEYLREAFPDWIRIAFHTYNANDPMYCRNYLNFTRDYVDGFPFGIINRMVDMTPSGIAPEYYQVLEDYVHSFPTYGHIRISYELNEDKTAVTVNSYSDFALDCDGNLGIAFAIVEDDLGPYAQSNYYSGGDYGDMEGWGSKGSSVETIFNDVARKLDGYPYIKDSLPAKIEKGETYEFERTLDLTGIDPEHTRIIAMIVNGNTGEIVNATEKPLYETSALNNLDVEKQPALLVENGSIIANGANVAVYTLDGRRVAANNLSKGIYIVNIDGKSFKVLVK